MRSVATIFLSFRWVVLGILSIATALAIYGNVRLTSEISGDADDQPSNSPHKILAEVEREFADPSGQCLLVVEAGTATEPKSIRFLRDVVADLKKVDNVDSIFGLDEVVTFRKGLLPQKLLPESDAAPSEFERAERELREHPLVIGQLVSEDLKTQVLRVQLADRLNWPTKRRAIRALQDRLTDWEKKGQARLAREPRLRLTGELPIRVDAIASTSRESNQFMVAGVVLAIGVAIFLFWDFWSVVIVATPPLIAVLWIRGYMGWVGEEPNGLNAVILPILVMMVGFTNAIHVMIDIRRNRAEGYDATEAAKLAIEHLGPACFWTSFTTSIGLFSLVLAEAEVIREFAITSTIGVGLSFVGVVSLVPIFSTTWVGRHIHRGHERDLVHRYRGFFDALIGWVIRYAGLVTALGILATAVMTSSILWLNPDDRIGDNFPQQSDSFQALNHCDQTIGGIQSIVIRVTWPEDRPLDQSILRQIGNAQDLFDDQPLVHYPVSVLDLLAVLPGKGELADRVGMLKLVPPEIQRRFVRLDRHQAIITGKCQNLGTAVFEPVLEEIEADLDRLQHENPDMKFELTGSLVVDGRFIMKAIRDLSSSLALAAVVIFFVVMIIFRSVRLGLISIIPNAFPLVLTASLLALSGLSLQITAVCAFTVCLGIAVDDTVHYLVRFRRELKLDGDVPAAAHRAFIAVGTAMILSTAIMLVGFLAVLTSGIPSSQLFARLALSTIGSALVGDLIILPAMLVMFHPLRKRRVPKSEAVQELECLPG